MILQHWRIPIPIKILRTRSSIGQSNRLLICRLQVRFLPSAPQKGVSMHADYASIIDSIINDKFVSSVKVDYLKSWLQYWDFKKEYMIGKRIVLISTSDPYTNVKPGDKGIVDHIDDAGTIFVNWDNGSGLGLIPGIDYFELLVEHG